MTEIVSEVPPMPDLVEPTPVYGTCPFCIRAVGVSRSGLLKEHKTPELVYSPSAKATWHCRGTGYRYAEYTNGQLGLFGKEWDRHRGAWVDLPVQIPVLVVADPRLDGEFPEWHMAEVFASEAAKIGFSKLAAHDRWRIQLYCTEEQATATLIDIPQGAVISTETHRRDGVAAMAQLISKMIARMSIAEKAEEDTRRRAAWRDGMDG